MIRIFLLILVLFNIGLSAQTEDVRPPESFPIYHAQKTYNVFSLDSIKGKLIDSIAEPEAYIFDENKNSPGFSYHWCIAIKRRFSYLVFDPQENSQSFFGEETTYRFDDIDGKGSKEIIFTWHSQDGSTGMEGMQYNYYGGIIIWNLDSLVRYMNYDNYYAHMEAGQWTETDSTGKSTTMFSSFDTCTYYTVSVSNKLVLIKQVNICDRIRTEPFPITDEAEHVYQFGSTGLRRRVQ